MKIYIVGKVKVLQQEEIEVLQNSLPVTLPSDYKAFLSAFGYGEINGHLRIGVPSAESFTENYPTYATTWEWNGDGMEKAVNGVTIVTKEGGDEFALAVADDEYPIMFLSQYSRQPMSFPSFEAMLDYYSHEHGFQDSICFDPYNNNVKIRKISLHRPVRKDSALMKQREQQFIDTWKFDRKFGDSQPRYVLKAMGGWVQFDHLNSTTITVRYQLDCAQKAAEVINFLTADAQATYALPIVHKRVLQHYEQVKLFHAGGGHMIVLFKDSRLQLNGYDIGQALPSYEPSLYKDVVFYHTSTDSINVHHIGTRKTDTLSWTGLLSESYLDGVAVFREDEKFHSIEVATQRVLSTVTPPRGAWRHFFKDHIVQTYYENQKHERVMCCRRHTGELLWQYDVKEEGRYHDFIRRTEPSKTGEVSKFIGLHDTCLVVALTGERLLGLDIHTGKKRWRIDSVPGAIPPYLVDRPGLANARSFKMDGNGHLYTFHQGIYIEINASTGEVVKTINHYERLRILDIALEHDQFYKDGSVLYYFRDGSRGALPQVIAYDIARQEPAWTHVFQAENKSEILMQYRLKSMVYDAGKIYVLDWNDVLTVLEVEN